MKHIKKTSLYLLLLFFPSISNAQLVFSPEGRYMITCYDIKQGGVQQPGTGSFPLTYNSSASADTERAFWIITEESSGKYSFKNQATNQYIKSSIENRDGKYVTLSNSLDGNACLFTIDTRAKDGAVYYAIASLSNPSYYFNKRSDGSFGTYSGSNGTGNNELFYFREKNELFESGTGAIFNYLNSFTLNGKALITAKNGIYYFSIPYRENETSISLSVNYETMQTTYTLKINNEEITAGQEFVFQNATATSGHKIDILHENRIIASEKVIFTSLPIVQLYSEGTNLSANFSEGKIKVNEGAKTNMETGELLRSDIRYRGASSLNYPKKSFAIKLKDETGESIDRTFCGLRNDNYWILDAMWVDPGRVRNRVATDLWNDFSSDPYYKSQEKNLINGTRGQFVEVFIDDVYWGLYCMTERIDRKQLKLKKYQEETQTIRGLLYKSVTWSYSAMMGYVPDAGPNTNYNIPGFNNRSNSWSGYEGDYPDLEDDEPFNWTPLYNAVEFAGKSSANVFKNEVAYYFDIPVWADYYLFIELILATDNHGKNTYLSIYDITDSKKMLVTPWDLDGTFGRQWSGSKVPSQVNFIEHIVKHEHGEHNLLRRLKENNTAGFNDILKKRYDELRFTWFSEKSLIERFEKYINLFAQSGAGTREYERWGNGLNFTQEMVYLDDWIRHRVAFLNKQYGEPIIAGTNNESVVFTVYPNPVSDFLYIKDIVPANISIYTETGICTYTNSAENTSVTIDFSDYDKGRYFLKIGEKGKMIIKR